MTLCSHSEPGHDGTTYRCDQETSDPSGLCDLHQIAECFLCKERLPLADALDHVCEVFRQLDRNASVRRMPTPDRIRAAILSTLCEEPTRGEMGVVWNNAVRAAAKAADEEMRK